MESSIRTGNGARLNIVDKVLTPLNQVGIALSNISTTIL